MSSKLLALGVMLAIFLLPSVLAIEYTCDSCALCQAKIDNASVGDVILLNTSISNQVWSCVGVNDTNPSGGIRTPGVVFDCQGNTINADSSGQTEDFGIGVYADNVTIRNCILSDRFEDGYVYMTGVSNLTVINLTTNGDNSGRVAIWASGCVNCSFTDVKTTVSYPFFSSCANCLLENSTLSNSGYNAWQIQGGFTGTFRNVAYTASGQHHIMNANNVVFDNVTCTNSGRCIYPALTRTNVTIMNSKFYNSNSGVYSTKDSHTNFTIINNNFTGNTYGLYLSGNLGTGLFIANNLFDNTNDVYLTGPTTQPITWNYDKGAGTNIIGGPLIGGNYWKAYEGGMTPADYGIGEPFNLTALLPNVATNQIDQYPLLSNFPSSCNSCDLCQSLVDGASSGDTIIMNASIVNKNSSCIGSNTSDSFNGGIHTDNITFDCLGYVIDGDGVYSVIEYGMWIEADNVTIKNCIIQEFANDYNFGVRGSSNITVENTTFREGIDTVGNSRYPYDGSAPNGCAFCNWFNNTVDNSATFRSTTYNHWDGGYYFESVTSAPAFQIQQSSFGVVENLVIDGKSSLINGANLLFRNVTFMNGDDATYGIFAVTVSGMHNITVDGCNFINNINDIHSSGIDPQNWTIINNNFTGSNSAIYVKETHGTGWVIANNIFNSSGDDVYIVGTRPISWNTTKQLGTNIIGGPYKGGNYWVNVSGVWDRDSDGIGEQPINISSLYPNVSGVQFDYLPLTENQDLYPPELVITLPTNSSYVTIDIDLNYTASDNVSGVDSCWYSINSSANTSIPGCNNITLPLVDGFFFLQVYVNDTAGWLTEESVYFTIDATVPSITIHTPLSQSYGSLPITLSVSVNEPIDTWYYNINGTNVTFTPNITLPITETGDYNLDVWANDSVDLWGKSTVAFSFSPYFLANNPFYLIIPIVLSLVAVSLLVGTIIGREFDLNKAIIAGVLMIITVVMIGVMFGVTV